MVIFLEALIIFGETRRKRSGKAVRKKGVAKITSFAELKPGDYVVHANHGIGVYKGIKQMAAGGTTRDYLDIVYDKGDKLYVPVDQLDLVQKYIGSEGNSPKINKLGGAEWQKAKAKARKSINEIAQDLVKLYAARATLKGHSFGKDTEWQRQFEDEFPYEETPDQLASLEEIKRDMESDKPMDRLLCGDVGYGKTEVAIRAAFKAVMDGKQVAFLVPTTILAEQHYKNLVKRFSDFPVKIDMISRFRTAKQQKATLQALKEGNVDILIGTQMVVKGHHFPNVTLVGVIAADSSLNIDDYRANERTFQILTQVAGRAGREQLEGNVIIQTYNPENFAIQCAKEQNYDKFYNTEIALREQLKYPPFSDIILIGFSSLNENEVKQIAEKTYQYFRKIFNTEEFNVLKPMPSPIDKIQNRFRWRIIIKGIMTENANGILNEYLQKFYNCNYKNTKVTIEINPNNMM